MPRGPAGEIGLRVNHQHVSVRSIGDPHLAAVQHVAVALLVRPRAHSHHVRPGAWFAHGQRADMGPGDQPGQIPLLLRLGSVAKDLIDAQVGVRPVRQPHRRRRAGNFLHRHDVLQIAHGGAAVFLADGDAEHTERAHFGPEIHRKGIVPIDRGGPGRDLGCGERLYLRAQHVGRFAQIEVQSRQAIGDAGHPRSFDVDPSYLGLTPLASSYQWPADPAGAASSGEFQGRTRAAQCRSRAGSPSGGLIAPTCKNVMPGPAAGACRHRLRRPERIPPPSHAFVRLARAAAPKLPPRPSWRCVRCA